MAIIFEYKPRGEYKRVITRNEFLKLNSQSGSEYTVDESIEVAQKQGLYVFADETSETPIGTIYATKGK